MVLKLAPLLILCSCSVSLIENKYCFDYEVKDARRTSLLHAFSDGQDTYLQFLNPDIREIEIDGEKTIRVAKRDGLFIVSGAVDEFTVTANGRESKIKSMCSLER